MNYDGVSFCAVEDTFRAGARLCKFNGMKLTWTTEGNLPNFDHLSLAAAGAQAWKLITDVCGLAVEYVTNPKTANVLTRFGGIDGPAGTLAWSKIFCGNTGQIDQLFDTSEAFVHASNPPANRISLVGTWCHENIHAVGLNGHLGPGNLMAATYNSQILRPQSGDIAELVARYGLPKPVEVPTVPVPVPPTVPIIPGLPGGELIMVDEKGKRWKYVGFVPVQ